VGGWGWGWGWVGEEGEEEERRAESEAAQRQAAAASLLQHRDWDAARKLLRVPSRAEGPSLPRGRACGRTRCGPAAPAPASWRPPPASLAPAPASLAGLGPQASARCPASTRASGTFR